MRGEEEEKRRGGRWGRGRGAARVELRVLCIHCFIRQSTSTSYRAYSALIPIKDILHFRNLPVWDILTQTPSR